MKSKLLRRFKVLWGSYDVWRPRLVFWAGAIAIGLISVAFTEFADWAQHAFHGLTESGRWGFLLPLLMTPAVFVLSAWLAILFFPEHSLAPEWRQERARRPMTPARSRQPDAFFQGSRGSERYLLR